VGAGRVIAGGDVETFDGEITADAGSLEGEAGQVTELSGRRRGRGGRQCVRYQLSRIGQIGELRIDGDGGRRWSGDLLDQFFEFLTKRFRCLRGMSGKVGDGTSVVKFSPEKNRARRDERISTSGGESCR
jgi:hypothetical protein